MIILILPPYLMFVVGDGASVVAIGLIAAPVVAGGGAGAAVVAAGGFAAAVVGAGGGAAAVVATGGGAAVLAGVVVVAPPQPVIIKAQISRIAKGTKNFFKSTSFYIFLFK